MSHLEAANILFTCAVDSTWDWNSVAELSEVALKFLFGCHVWTGYAYALCPSVRPDF